MEFRKLERLNLSHNKIKSVTRTTEDNVAVNSLQSLDLSFNNLQVIHPLGGIIHCNYKAGLYLLVLQTKAIRRFVITEKAPTRAFSWLKAATTVTQRS